MIKKLSLIKITRSYKKPCTKKKPNQTLHLENEHQRKSLLRNTLDET